MSDFEELRPPELHMWLSACRHLMAERPIDGAWPDNPVFAAGHIPRPGWNKEIYADGRSSYIFFDRAKRHADRKRFLPEGVDEATVNVIRPILPRDARSTPLWKRASALAPTLPQRLMPTGLRKPKLVMQEIGRFTALARKAEDISRITPVEAVLKGVDFGSSNARDPAIRVVRQYMRFALPGLAARYLLCGVYTGSYLAVPTMVERRFAPLTTMLMRKIENLADAAYRLYRARRELNVNGYFNASYLATLCAGAVITLCSDDGGRLAKLRFSDGNRDRIDRLRQNADELAAHYLYPAFELPARFYAQEILDWVHGMAALEGRRPVDTAEEHCLHPGLVTLVDDAEIRAAGREEVEKRYHSTVSGLPGLSIEAAIEREAPALRLNMRDYLVDY